MGGSSDGVWTGLRIGELLALFMELEIPEVVVAEVV